MIRDQHDLAAAKASGSLCSVCTLEVASVCRRVGCAEDGLVRTDQAHTQGGTGSVRRPRPDPRRLVRIKASSEEGGLLYRVGYWIFFSAVGAAVTAGLGVAMQMAAR